MTWTSELNVTHARDIIAEHYPNPTPLEQDVIDWLVDIAGDYDDQTTAWESMRGVLQDLAYGGCSSGMVSHLVYNSDVLDYYDRHGAECARVVQDVASDCACSIGELLRDWDNDDPIALELNNQTKLAWAGFEETAQRIGYALNMDI